MDDGIFLIETDTQSSNHNEKVIRSIKEAQGTVAVEHPGGGGGGSGGGGASRSVVGGGGGGSSFVPESEIAAVEARASQLMAFATNADASR